jgi:hypothetical protein
MSIAQIGEIMKYRRTGNMFSLKKITKDFVILYALDGSPQIMTAKESLNFLFEIVSPLESSLKNALKIAKTDVQEAKGTILCKIPELK